MWSAAAVIWDFLRNENSHSHTTVNGFGKKLGGTLKSFVKKNSGYLHQYQPWRSLQSFLASTQLFFSSNTFQFSTRIQGFKIVNRIPSSPTHTHSLALQHSSNKIQNFKMIRWQLKPLTYWPELTSQISFHILAGMICSGSYQPSVAPLKGEI